MKVTFPHMGNLYVIIKVLLDELGVEYEIPPFNNREALEIGTKYAPELACLPLKINLGNFMQAAGQGADTVLIAGGCGPCRFGYYCEMHREILKDAGCKMEVMPLEPPGGNMMELLKRARTIAEGASLLKILGAIKKAVRVANKVDNLDRLAFKIRPREAIKGKTDTIYREFQRGILRTCGTENIIDMIDRTMDRLSGIRINTGIKPLKVGIVGEIYTVIDPFANLFIEEKLGGMGVEVHRSLMLGEWIDEHIIKKLLPFRHAGECEEAARPFLYCMIGGHARETIGNTVLYAKNGYDGVIQLLPLSCMPEIVAESILPAVERKYGIPVLTLIIDEMTGEAGYLTRLEAFVDLLNRRREQKQP